MSRKPIYKVLAPNVVNSVFTVPDLDDRHCQSFSGALPDMGKKNGRILEIFRKLESSYGKQEPCWPTDPYRFLVWWHSGYPASDAACAKGWHSLTKEIGIEPEQLLTASPANLASALRRGGMVPELRAVRLKEIAARVKDEFGGDLRATLVEPVAQVRKILKKVSEYRRSRRRPHTALCGHRTSGCRGLFG